MYLFSLFFYALYFIGNCKLYLCGFILMILSSFTPQSNKVVAVEFLFGLLFVLRFAGRVSQPYLIDM